MMKLQGMTGFARAAGETAGAALVWELRSVNGKALDVRLRLPPGWDRVETPARQAFSRHFARGTIQAVLSVVRDGALRPRPIINEALLDELAALAQSLSERFGTAPPSADGLLALPGVMLVPSPGDSADVTEQAERAAMACLEEALGALEVARQAEGETLRSILLQQVDAMHTLAMRVESDPSRQPAAIRERLAAQVQLLLGAHAGLDESRLMAEAALLATRADIREEMDRLRMHCASARALLNGNGPAGRKLDFLGQELNREANTLCSKSNAPALTAAGLELKAVVDQFREQVQNLE